MTRQRTSGKFYNVLSIAVALVMLIGACFAVPLGITASAEDLTEAVFDFDANNAALKTGIPYSGGAYTIQPNPDGTGNVLGLNANFAGHNHCDPRDLSFNDGTDKITLAAGKYRIEYKYYAKYGTYASGASCCVSGCATANATNFELKFGVVSTTSFGATSSTNVKAAKSDNNIVEFDIVSAENTETSEWQSGSVMLTVTADMVSAGNNNLAICMNKVPFAVYLDDITVSKYISKVSNYNFDADTVANANAGGFKVSGGLWSVENCADYGIGTTGKALAAAYKSMVNNGAQRPFALNDGTAWHEMEAGVYKISYQWYAKVSANDDAALDTYYQHADLKNVAYSTAFCVAKQNDGFWNNSNFAYMTLTRDNVVPDAYASVKDGLNNVALDSWQNASVYVTVTQDMIDEGFKYLAISSTGVKFNMFLDNVTVEKTASVIFDYGDVQESMPVSGNTITAPSNPEILNLTGWQLSGTDNVYACGAAIPTAELTGDSVFTAVYGGYSIDFEKSVTPNIGNSMGGGVSSLTTDADHGNVMQLTRISAGSRHFMLHETVGDSYGFVAYKANQQYLVTFDYKHVSGDEANLYFAFGIKKTAYSSTMDAVSHNDMMKIPATDTGWKTASCIVTAPADYKVTNSSYGVTAARYVGIGVYGAADSVNMIDNITVTAITADDYAPVIKGYDLFVNNTDKVLNDINGNTMPAHSAVYRNASNKQRSAFRIVAGYDYSGDKTRIKVGDKAVEVIRRGILFGTGDATAAELIAKTEGKYLSNSEVPATQNCWDDNGSSIEYTFKVFNISKTKKSTVYSTIPYVIVNIDGKETALYGEYKTMSADSVYTGTGTSLAWYE